DDHDRLPDEEAGGAEEPGDRLAELPEHLRVVGEVEPTLGPRSRELGAALHDPGPSTACARERSWRRCRSRQPAPSMRSTTSSTLIAPRKWPASSTTAIDSMSYDANSSNTARSVMSGPTDGVLPARQCRSSMLGGS